MNPTERFQYKKVEGITALSASIQDFTYKKHSHQEYSFGVTLRGIQRFTMDGSLQLSHAGGVMMFNPEQAHDGMANGKEGLDYVMLYIDPQMLNEAAGQKDWIYFSSPVVYDSALQRKILELSQVTVHGGDEALRTERLLSLADHLTGAELVVPHLQDPRLISAAKEMLHTDLAGVVKLDEISQELNLSKFQFIRMFKAQTGISPYQYFLNRKIEYAKQLIEQKKDVYTAVAECGFVDLTHLNKHFKSVYGITAFEYMNVLS
ncbi:AraC family transcriptional regulator [Saccharibacillus sp. JS10]|uniref:AraC family transcriptional regulator n=1 Tax=Saccharibacillus sp. JS10 TaxID=2950552 RepID=UPI00210B86E5|nr:AraC family transcriptional regulator [Saccharibacillus sp. JS10]MCQ4085534.1 AraC family transcriptional regulator [Saccharibacillus sp. JS10]